MLFKGSDVVFERVVVNESKIGLFIKAINQTVGQAALCCFSRVTNVTNPVCQFDAPI